MSDTISSGGFSSASAYCRSWLNAASRLARRPLYSQAKWWRFQTSAQPSPPASLRAPRSKQYVSPVGSASAGVGSPSRRHRSMKCSCEAERSFNSEARHFVMNSFGVTTRSSFSAGTRAEGGVLHGGSLTGRVRLRAPRPGPRGARRPAGRTAPQAGERLSPTAAAGAGRAWSPGQASHASTSRSAPFNRAISKTRRSRRASPTLTTTEGPAGIFPPRNCRGMPYNEALRESHVSSPRSGRRGRRCVRGASLRLGDQRLDNDQVFPGFL